MPFRKRYILVQLAPGFIFGIPLALLFLSQLLQFSAIGWTAIVGTAILFYAIGGAIFALSLRKDLEEVERASATGRGASAAMSQLVDGTMRATNRLWIGGGLLFAILGVLFLMPTPLGVAYFVTAVAIAAAPSIGWTYFAGKRLVLKYLRESQEELRYTGRRFPLRTKIAVVFVSFFVISIIAIILLVSSKVSTTLETVAISQAESRFESAHTQFENATGSARARLDASRASMDAADAVWLIDSSGTVSGARGNPDGASLEPEDIASIRRLRNGDSSRYIAPSVALFRETGDGSILVLEVPWSQYGAVPRQIAFYTLIVGFLTTIVFTLATIVLARDVGDPIARLIRSTEALAGGNFARHIQVVSDDEIGDLAGTFAKTRENLRSLIARVGASGGTITEGVRVITSGTETIVARATDQSTLTRTASDSLATVSMGAHDVLDSIDKVGEATQDVSSRAVELQASAEEVARSMDFLFQSVDKSVSSVTEMSASINESSKRTDSLAGIGDEVLSFVAQMDSTVEELRSTAVATADISRKVREEAEEGGTAVTATVEGISESQESTQRAAAVLDELQNSVVQITQILNVIEEVAEKTNLLSLNAAIIAAQAGEQGAGFTVVAEEIRQLADRTRGSTKEISGIVKAVQAGSREAVRAMGEGLVRVNANVELAQAASERLRRIVGSAARSYEMANRISQALDEQAKASRHLHQVSSRMSDTIGEINRASREQAKTSEMLAREAERVREIALQVKNATSQQSSTGRGITIAVEQIAGDVTKIREMLNSQLEESERISEIAQTLLQFADENNAIANDFNTTVRNLLRSGRDFENEVGKFTLK